MQALRELQSKRQSQITPSDALPGLSHPHKEDPSVPCVARTHSKGVSTVLRSPCVLLSFNSTNLPRSKQYIQCCAVQCCEQPMPVPVFVPFCDPFKVVFVLVLVLAFASSSLCGAIPLFFLGYS